MTPRFRTLFAVGVLVTYVVVAQLTGDLFPLSPFPMYAGQHASTSSRVVARGNDGTIREVDAYDAFSCEGPIDLSLSGCPSSAPYYYIPYIDQAAAEHVQSHRGQGGEAVDVVRHIWRLQGGATRVEDCLLQRCSARRR